MYTKPLSPREVFCLKHVPCEIIKIFNDLIVEKADEQVHAVITQKEVIDRIVESGLVEYRADVFKAHWLDIKYTYKESGWLVGYDNRICKEECDLSYYFNHSCEDWINSYDYNKPYYDKPCYDKPYRFR